MDLRRWPKGQQSGSRFVGGGDWEDASGLMNGCNVVGLGEKGQGIIHMPAWRITVVTP